MKRVEMWNRPIRWLLIVVMAIGLAASIPLWAERTEVENSANQVELVLDYRDLLEIAAFKPNTAMFIEHHLNLFQEAGVTSMAVYESTLEELRHSGHLQFYSGREAALLTGDPSYAQNNWTYILFADEQRRDVLQPILELTLGLGEISTDNWTFTMQNRDQNGNGQLNDTQHGLVLQLDIKASRLLVFAPDPLTMQQLHDRGFQIVVRLSNRIQPFDRQMWHSLMTEWTERYQVNSVIFDGTSVTGFAQSGNDHEVYVMAELFEEFGWQAAFIELNPPQAGLAQLAFLSDYQIVRLHSISERESVALTAERIADRLALAVKDRNIRMIFLNTILGTDTIRRIHTDSLENMLDALSGPDGAVAKIQQAGFEIGISEPFQNTEHQHKQLLQVLVLLGIIALAGLTAAAFIPVTALPVCILVGLAAAALYLRSGDDLLVAAFALLAAVCAPTLGAVLAIRFADRQQARAPGRWQRVGLSLIAFVMAMAVASISIFFIVALMNHITYLLGLRLFRGVSLLHLAPMALVALFLYMFRSGFQVSQAREAIWRLLRTPLTLLWVVIFGAIFLTLQYYLSRTGNQGFATGIETAFRALLEDVFGVRPRTKEFLLGHPLLILAIYLGLRWRHAAWLMVGGVVGLLSVVGTFAHVHTPLVISVSRVVYGGMLGIITGLAAIALFESILWVWRKYRKTMISNKYEVS